MRVGGSQGWAAEPGIGASGYLGFGDIVTMAMLSFLL